MSFPPTLNGCSTFNTIISPNSHSKTDQCSEQNLLRKNVSSNWLHLFYFFLLVTFVLFTTNGVTSTIFYYFNVMNIPDLRHTLENVMHALIGVQCTSLHEKNTAKAFYAVRKASTAAGAQPELWSNLFTAYHSKIMLVYSSLLQMLWQKHMGPAYNQRG